MRMKPRDRVNESAAFLNKLYDMTIFLLVSHYTFLD